MKDDHKRRCLSSLDMHLTPPLFRASFGFELRCNLLTLAKTQWGEFVYAGGFTFCLSTIFFAPVVVRDGKSKAFDQEI